MSNQTGLTNQQNRATIYAVGTNDRQLAKQLAAHHLALAQVYRKMAGEPPIPTGSQQRKQVTQANRR